MYARKDALMFQDLKRMSCELRRGLSHFEPERVTTDQAASVFEIAAEVELLAGSLKLLAAKRAAKSGMWAKEGHRLPASWVAKKSKSSYGEAISLLETAEQLVSLPRTTEALKNGRLSRSQVKEVAQAASSHPGAEDELLRVAADGTMKNLKERARQVRACCASKEGELARYRAIHRRRYLRYWNDEEGALCLDAKLTPDFGARLVASLQSKADAIFEEARVTGARKPAYTYMADALVSLVTGEGQGASSRKDRSPRMNTDTLVIRVDAQALRRGFVKGTETCEIPGVGPVPVATAEGILGKAFVKILVKDGVDVASVCHVGRSVPVHVQSALEERDLTCAVPECDTAFGLENHHWKEDYASCQMTSLDALARVCRRHHHLITYEGFELVGGPGRWRLVAPAGVSRLDTS
jgi:hypothetical protein